MGLRTRLWTLSDNGILLFMMIKLGMSLVLNYPARVNNAHIYSLLTVVLKQLGLIVSN